MLFWGELVFFPFPAWEEGKCGAAKKNSPFAGLLRFLPWAHPLAHPPPHPTHVQCSAPAAWLCAPRAAGATATAYGVLVLERWSGRSLTVYRYEVQKPPSKSATERQCSCRSLACLIPVHQKQPAQPAMFVPVSASVLPDFKSGRSAPNKCRSLV